MGYYEFINFLQTRSARCEIRWIGTLDNQESGYSYHGIIKIIKSFGTLMALLIEYDRTRDFGGMGAWANWGTHIEILDAHNSWN